MKKSIIALLIACQLAGCASPMNRARLENYKMGCANGSASDCYAVPAQENVNRAEAAENAGKVVVFTVLLPLIVLAAMADVRACGRYGYC
jgi:hypothetical protein